MRLLDLTARNRLINFRHTKSGSLRVIDELPNQLVETLLAETEMRFAAIPEPTEKELIEAEYLKIEEESRQIVGLRNDPSAEEWANQLGFATNYEVPESPTKHGTGKHRDNVIQTLLYPHEMEARLKNLMQAAVSAIQETGANILYLAFGFLEWYENSSSVRKGCSDRLSEVQAELLRRAVAGMPDHPSRQIACSGVETCDTY